MARRAFRLLALLLPFLLVGFLELVLRWAGFGFPTGFFLHAQAENREVLVDNPRYGWRYFPREMARTPVRFSIPAHKAPGTCRIFILGESAAMGDPEPAFGFARMLEALLAARFPEVRFEVINAAMTAINSNVILPIARDCAGQEPDLWILYMGNNEVVGPFGAGTVFGGRTASRPWIKAQIALGRTRIGQLLRVMAGSLGRRKTDAWEGMELFLENRIRASDPALERVHAHFQSNLDEILRIGAGAGCKQILCTVAVREKDGSPFASSHRPGLGATDEQKWTALFREGTVAEAAGKFDPGLAAYRGAEAVDSEHAELEYRMGRCALALKDASRARQYFRKALDLDCLRFRADSRMEQIIRDRGAKTGGGSLVLVDAAGLMATNSPGGIPGAEYFYDHVHLNFEGNYLLAKTLAEQCRVLLPERLKETRGGAARWLTIEECARRLGWTEWSQSQVLQDLRRRFSRPPFTNQLESVDRREALEREIAELAPFSRLDGLQSIYRQYRAALADHPGDWVLHEKLGEALRDGGRFGEAISEWETVIQKMPHHAGVFNNIGTALSSLGRAGEAEEYFRRALRLDPGLVEAYNGLGLALSREGKGAEGEAAFRRALRIRPNFVPAYVNLGLALQSRGDSKLASETFSNALRIAPDHPAVHANLGRIAAGAGRLDEALHHFTESARLMPSSAPMHFNLGNLFLARGETNNAIQAFTTATTLQSDYFEARLNLGILLLRQGRFAEAADDFAVALRSHPESAVLHLNFGIALLELGRRSEATAQFRETLRIDPGNATARQFLGMDGGVGRGTPAR